MPSSSARRARPSGGDVCRLESPCRVEDGGVDARLVLGVGHERVAARRFQADLVEPVLDRRVGREHADALDGGALLFEALDDAHPRCGPVRACAPRRAVRRGAPRTGPARAPCCTGYQRRHTPRRLAGAARRASRHRAGRRVVRDPRAPVGMRPGRRRGRPEGAPDRRASSVSSNTARTRSRPAYGPRPPSTPMASRGRGEEQSRTGRT